MLTILSLLHDMVWGVPALIAIVGVGLYLTVISGFPQIYFLPEAFRCVRRSQCRKAGSVTSFQALCTALAATVGTGNIIGVAGAICLGGPGVVFWMWVCGFLGMATKFAEVTLALRYRIRRGKTYFGGPMYIIREGMRCKWHCLALIYAVLGLFAAFGVGSATQVNAVISGMSRMLPEIGGGKSQFFNLIMGIGIASILGILISGGAERVGRAAERVIPILSIGYILLCIGICVQKVDMLGDALKDIFRGAWNPKAVSGGTIGSVLCCLRVGCARGLFSNEAGMGTASIAHASAQVDHPVEQGMMGLIEVFVDTHLICTLSALAILCSGIPIPFGLDKGTVLLMNAFSSVYGQWAELGLTFTLSAFAFATVLGWGLYGNCFAGFLLGSQHEKMFISVQMLAIILGSVLNTQTVWSLAETINGMMAIPNLIALTALSPELRRLTIEYKRGGILRRGGTYANFY